MHRRTLLTTAGAAAAGASGALGSLAGCATTPSLPGGGPSVGEREALPGDAAWPQRHLDARNSSYAPGSGPTPPVETRELLPPGTVDGPVRVGDGMVYAETREGIGRVPLDGGEPEPGWIAGPDRLRSLTLTEDHLVTSHDRFEAPLAVGYERATGESAWTNDRVEPPYVADPTRSGGRLYWPLSSVCVVDPSTGAIAGRHTGSAQAEDESTPAVVDDTTYFHEGDTLSAVGPDGRQRYSRDVSFPTPVYPDDRQALHGPVVADEDHLLAMKGYTFAHRGPIGRSPPTPPAAGPGPPLPHGKPSFPTDHGEYHPVTTNPPPHGDHAAIYGFDRETGARRWTVELDGLGVYGPPALADGVAFVTATAVVPVTEISGTVEGDGAADGRVSRAAVHAIDTRDGSRFWTRTFDEPVVQSDPPVVADGPCYLNQGRRVLALVVTSGETEWSLSLDGFLTNRPRLVDGTLLVTTDDGTLLAVE
ncbi:MAG: PQQ-binding-like beta-propeller repeat protein [Halobacteriaceae archaeon]